MLELGKWSASRPGRFTPATHLILGQIVTRTSLEAS
jgi:hypothetical protein